MPKAFGEHLREVQQRHGLPVDEMPVPIPAAATTRIPRIPRTDVDAAGAGHSLPPARVDEAGGGGVHRPVYATFHTLLRV
jgi:hypothetical protein